MVPVLRQLAAGEGDKGVDTISRGGISAVAEGSPERGQQEDTQPTQPGVGEARVSEVFQISPNPPGL